MLKLKGMKRDWVISRLKQMKSTQTKLARAMNLHPSALNKMFKGERQLKASESNLMAEFLGIPVAELMSRLGLVKDGLAEAGEDYYQPMRKTLLHDIMVVIQEVYARHGVHRSAADIFEEATQHYDRINTLTPDQNEQKGAVKLLGQQLNDTLSKK